MSVMGDVWSQQARRLCYVDEGLYVCDRRDACVTLVEEGLYVCDGGCVENVV